MFDTKTRSSVHEELNERKFYSSFSMNSAWFGLALTFAFICTMEFHDNGATSNSSLVSKRAFSIVLKTYIYMSHCTHDISKATGFFLRWTREGLWISKRHVCIVWCESFLRRWKNFFYLTLVNDQLDAQFLDFILRLLQSCTCFEQRRARHQEVKLY
jgi:hypothetical protein